MDYDLCLAWNWEYDAGFAALLEEAAREHGVSLLQVTPPTLDATLDALRQGQLSFGVLLDRASDTDERFLHLVAWAQDHRAAQLNRYQEARRAWDKAAMHRLLSPVLPTPTTIVLPPHAEQPMLPSLDLATLGPSFNIKPAHGGGGEGVVMGATTVDQVQAARQEHPHDHYLLQSHVDPVIVEERLAWFRPIFACGQVLLCWWDTETHRYTPLDPADEERLELGALRTIVARIARQCDLDLFSCEIARRPDGRFVLVDYVNDPLDLRLQSQSPEGVPDAIIEHIAHCLAARARMPSQARLQKEAGCSIMASARQVLDHLRASIARSGRGSILSGSAPNRTEQGVAMEETPQDILDQSGPDTPTGSTPPTERFILLRWWDRAVQFARDLWARRPSLPSLPHLPRRPQPIPPDPAEIARWVALLGHPDDPAHAQALDELVVIGKPAVPALVEALYSETWIQTFRASEALGLIGDRRAVRHLKRQLGHANSNVRWGAAEALGRIRSRWARGRLKRAAQEDENRTSWGETVAEAAERAVASIDQTWVSRLVNVLWIVFYLALCAVVVFTAYGFVRDALLELRRSMATPTPTLFTPQPTATITPTLTPTPLPAFIPITGTIVSDGANIRDQPNGVLIDVLNYGDEVLVYGGWLDEAETWWYLVRLDEIHNSATNPDGPLGQGSYGWVWAARISAIAGPEIGPTVEAIETMRAAVATPTPIGNARELATPTPILTATVAPTATVSP